MGKNLWGIHISPPLEVRKVNLWTSTGATLNKLFVKYLRLATGEKKGGENMSQKKVTISGTAEWFKMLDAFLALAEAGGSMQARIARMELGNLTDAQKIKIESRRDFDQIEFNIVVNSILLKALSVCERNRREKAPEGMSYGNDIIIRHHPRVYANERLLTLGGSTLQFLWLAHSRFEPGFKEDRYVGVWFVRADSEIEINGRASDVVKLFNKSKVSEIIPEWFSYESRGILPLDMGQLAKGRIVSVSD